MGERVGQLFGFGSCRDAVQWVRGCERGWFAAACGQEHSSGLAFEGSAERAGGKFGWRVDDEVIDGAGAVDLAQVDRHHGRADGPHRFGDDLAFGRVDGRFDS